MISNHTKRYWQYEYDVAAKYMIPLLKQWGVQPQGTTMIDVGCGEGGGVCAMYDSGMQCVGFDIEEHRVQMARAMQGNRNIEWALGDLYSSTLPFSDRQYDLVVLHDVFEHLEEKHEVLEKLRRYMKPDGRLMMTFPPYYSAYGAHQQLLNAPWMKFPFFHLLPFTLTKILPRIKGESSRIVEEVQKLGELRMGMRKFEQIAARGGLKIVGKQAYIISPNHIRFGLKPIPAGPVAEIPIIGEVVCTGVVYLLGKLRHLERSGTKGATESKDVMGDL
jgi:ubiquinone/menaquinone biosynthesis C-methylase UbiE